MSFAFAGALMGAGKALQEIAEEKRRLANEILKMEAAGKIKATRAGGGKGGGGKGGSGSGSSVRLSNSDEVRIEKEYENLFENTPQEERPSLSDFKSEIVRRMGAGEDRQTATSGAAQSWKGREVETGEMEQPGLWGRITGKKPEPKTEMRYGFDSALGEPQAAPAPNPETAPSAPPAAANDGAAAALEQARNAIAQGADRNKVIERLRSMGIDPKGL